MRDNLDELRHIEGFPLGEDEDLHALSNPPYYTAYPNPHIVGFVEKYRKPFNEATDEYHREPYVSDVSEGKNDPVYRGIPYHTKVPFKAIIPFIKHYSEPGDIVYDGFSGTGMTGVAAQTVGRNAILCDLSPVATLISFNNNSSYDRNTFIQEANQILKEVEEECGWLYETHYNGKKGTINYTVWSSIYFCPYCKKEFVYWDETVYLEQSLVVEEFSCPGCNARLRKKDLVRIKDVSGEKSNGKIKRVPVLISYTLGSKRFEKPPSSYDHETIAKIEAMKIPYWYPPNAMMMKGENWGDTWRAGIHSGITNIGDFFTKRNLWTLSVLFDRIQKSENSEMLLILFISILDRVSIRNRYMPQHRDNRNRQVVGPLSGTLYVPDFSLEINPIQYAIGKVNSIANALEKQKEGNFIVTTQSATQLMIQDDVVDYIFTDPPFGDNLIYSELNFIWESWLKVFTNNKSEAIKSEVQGKYLNEYRNLMTRAFAEMYRVLKPGRWITVVFHNSKASVWNSIQEGLARAGFMVAQVTVMDKKKGTIKQLTAPSAVKNDLVINAYKPRAQFEKSFISQAGRGLEAEFIGEHLRQLPKTANIERSKEMLYSKYLAYYVQRGYHVQYNGEQFYHDLPHWGFIERDGYWFEDEEQVNEYEKQKLKAAPKGKKGIPQGQGVLFISDERSARQWLWEFLREPKSFSEIHSAYYKALMTSEDKVPDPKDLLEEGFVRTNGDWKRPDSLTQTELEKRRQERLLRQFEDYLKAAKSGQRLKEVRKEALVAGFTEAYRESRFADILAVGHKLPKRLLEESPDLYDFVDIAEAKMEK